MEAQGICIGFDPLGPQQLGHHLLERNIREAFIALACRHLPCLHGIQKCGFQFFSRIFRAVKAEENGAFFPNLGTFLCVDIHQRAVKVKNQIPIFHFFTCFMERLMRWRFSSTLSTTTFTTSPTFSTSLGCLMRREQTSLICTRPS